MKKFLLVLSLILSINAVSFAAFSDVKNYKDEIDYLTSKKIISGYEDGTFKPDAKITRAELVKMIVTATEKTNTKTNNFTDVEKTHWARKYIDIAIANDLIKGDTEGTFRPEDNITYGEVATILVRAMEKVKDAEKINLEWPLNYLKEAEELDLFDGYATNDLTATNEARRDNVALMIYNMLNPTDDDKTKTDDKATTTVKVDTKTAFAGIVVKQVQRRGEKYITLKDTSNKESQIKLSEKYDMPEINSFLIYKLNSRGEVDIKRKLLKKDVDNTFTSVTKVDGEIAWLKDQDKVLDLELDEYELNGKTIKLKKYNYFVISSMGSNSSSYKLVKLENLKLKKNDKIKFDDTYNVCYIIR